MGKQPRAPPAKDCILSHRSTGQVYGYTGKLWANSDSPAGEGLHFVPQVYGTGIGYTGTLWANSEGPAGEGLHFVPQVYGYTGKLWANSDSPAGGGLHFVPQVYGYTGKLWVNSDSPAGEGLHFVPQVEGRRHERAELLAAPRVPTPHPPPVCSDAPSYAVLPSVLSSDGVPPFSV